MLTIGAEPNQTAVGFMTAKALLKIEKLLLELLFIITVLEMLQILQGLQEQYHAVDGKAQEQLIIQLWKPAFFPNLFHDPSNLILTLQIASLGFCPVPN